MQDQTEETQQCYGHYFRGRRITLGVYARFDWRKGISTATLDNGKMLLHSQLLQLRQMRQRDHNTVVELQRRMPHLVL